MQEERDALTDEPTAEPEVQDDSPMGRLRELRRKSREDKNKTLDVPGYEGQLGVRYRSVPRDELRKVYGKGKKDDIDLLIHLCDCIVVRNDQGEFEALENEHQMPVKFDESLAKFLEIEIKGERKARECLEGVFSLDLHPLAASVHVKALIAWMEGVDEEADKEYLGE